MDKEKTTTLKSVYGEITDLICGIGFQLYKLEKEATDAKTQKIIENLRKHIDSLQIVKDKLKTHPNALLKFDPDGQTIF